MGGNHKTSKKKTTTQTKTTTTTTTTAATTTNANNTTACLSDAMEDALFLKDSDRHHHHDEKNAVVSSASYPIPDPLSRLLKGAIVGLQEDNHTTTTSASNGGDNPNAGPKLVVESDSVEEGLKHLVANAFQGLDSMYFATPGAVRNKPSFAHRLCLRVSTSKADKTLTITDLGSGMTRADLINSLGVGRSLSHRAKSASNHLAALASDSAAVSAGGRKEDENDHDDSDDDDEEEDSEDETESDDEYESSSEDDEEESEDTSQKSQIDSTPKSIHLPCKKKDIGGFYSALCALGTSIQVCTKSKFDDYYEFQVAPISTTMNNPTEQYDKFTITRPMEEGSRPTLHNGFTHFSDIRGDSGTKVVITLNSKAIEAGFLEEQNVLKPFFSKILETSQYSVAFSTDDTKSVKAIIQASDEEDRDMEASKHENNDIDDKDFESSVDENSNHIPSTHNTVLERSKFIPLRLSLGERKMLRLVEATMACADYTTMVDNHAFKSKARRTHAQLKAITAILRGMVSACDYAAGQKLNNEGNYGDYQDFFRSMFEIARRHKIMNPEKMRTEYGKLIYLLQDAVSPSIQPHLGFSVKGPILTVYRFLQERDGLALLKDPYIEIATQEVLAEKKTRAKINAEIKRKEKAVAHLKQKYRTMKLNSEDIHLCLYSICDNNSFLNSNRVPIDKVIGYLQTFFEPSKIQKGYSLSIISGQDGARLSHNHERQFYFALQSLTLWRDIVDDMFRLWHMEEEDLLSDSVTYALKDTGQGMQRIQQSPRTYKAMQTILARVQGKVNMWIGSSVIHLGDHNVPNALSFIDKYTQVPRILGPIVVCLENLERICEEDDGIAEYVKTTFGGLERVKKDILFDFFRSAFDGSGADNFYDAGSCIDGRLTSAWNWCSQLPTKKYYTIFKLTGFIGFDGEFK